MNNFKIMLLHHTLFVALGGALAFEEKKHGDYYTTAFLDGKIEVEQ